MHFALRISPLVFVALDTLQGYGTSGQDYYGQAGYWSYPPQGYYSMPPGGYMPGYTPQSYGYGNYRFVLVSFTLQ